MAALGRPTTWSHPRVCPEGILRLRVPHPPERPTHTSEMGKLYQELDVVVSDFRLAHSESFAFTSYAKCCACIIVFRKSSELRRKVEPFYLLCEGMQFNRRYQS